MLKIKPRLLLFISFFCFQLISAQEKYTLSGHITDAATGEELISATLFVPTLNVGTTTNAYGFYSITLPAGDHKVVFSYLGFQEKEESIALQDNTTIDVELISNLTALEEVVVTAAKEDEHVDDVAMSQVRMDVEAVKKMPALLGEVDIIKAIQLLPGVATVGEGTSGFYVRGGSVDQNLILLDEAPVYNASHLLGFFSVFNPDAVKDMQLYKGAIPANYGGRLSSVLDIRMKEGSNKGFRANGGIGTISSRLTVEAPLGDEKGSFMISGRRTYIDLFLGLSKDTTLRQSKLFFYDLNAKANYRLSKKDRVFLSGYLGRDVFNQGNDFATDWGNKTATFRWNHLFGPKLFSNLTYFYSNFDYSLGQPSGVEAFQWDSKLQNHSLKLDFTLFANPKHTVKFGAQTILHKINPGRARGTSEGGIFNELKLDPLDGIENAIYISNTHTLNQKIRMEYGLRVSSFHNVGADTVFNYDKNFTSIDSSIYAKGEIYNEYYNLEPRFGIRYTLDKTSSLKASYNRTAQYIQLASNTTASSPLDIWFPSSKNVQPQLADQIAMGYFRNFRGNMFETSAEVYYKKFTNAIDFKDHAELLLNEKLEGELRFGEGRAYGAEFMVRKNQGRLTGWISYTLARVEKKIEEINNGNWYHAKHDKRHDASLVLAYELSPRISLSGNWVFSSGSAVTFPTGRYEHLGTFVPIYSDRNAERLPNYHRMDLSLTLKNKRKLLWLLPYDTVFSLYNAYNRKNAYSINFKQDPDDPTQTIAEKTYLFGIIPSVTLNFNIN